MKPKNKELLPECNLNMDSEACRLISTTTSCGAPSVVATETASSSSVNSASSTKPLLYHHNNNKKTKTQNNTANYKFDHSITSMPEDMSQKEKNMLLVGRDLDTTKCKKSLGDYGPCELETTVSNRQAYLRQGLAAFSVSLGSAVVGFSSAYTSPALESMKQPGSTLNITEQQASWIGSLMPLSALLGGIIGGPLVETLGRKKTILLTAIPFGISFILIAFATNIGMIMAGRSLAGFCVGIASLALPVYLGEVIQPDVRGTLGLLPTAIGNGGILICFLAGKYLDWSKLAMFGACLPIPFFILMFLIPETPRWFIGKKMDDKAKKSLEWLRGKNADITKELSELQKSMELFNENKTSVTELFNKKYLCPFAISMGLMFFQQLSGINAVIFYTVTIFKDAGSTIDSNLSAIIVGLVNLGSTLVATALIDRVGRKVLMYISNCIMATTLVILGTFFYMKNNGTDMTQYGWIPLASFVIYVIGFSIGAGPIPWLMMGEILPAKIRGTAASIVTSFNWACTFLVTKTFVDLTLLLGSHGAFWLFGVICLFSLAFVIIFVPETRGRSLEDIERYYMGRQTTNENGKVLDILPNDKSLA